MPDFLNILGSTEINSVSIIIRLLLSLVLGGAVGIERERHKQLAGFRTHILICIGSTLLMMLSIHLPRMYSPLGNGDPGRIAAQVVSGIGFLGAGAILRIGANVRGITTAATIWMVAALGLTVGAGMYSAAIAGTFITIFVLTALDKMEKSMFPAQYLKYMHITFDTITMKSELVLDILRMYRIKIRDFEINQSPKINTTNMKIFIQVKKDTDFKHLYEDLEKIEGIVNISLESLK